MDKSLSIFLIVLVGMAGIAIVLLAWIQPIPMHEKIFPTFVGSMGIVAVSIRALTLRSELAKRNVVTTLEGGGVGERLNGKPSGYHSRLATNDATRSIIQPITVHPVKMFSRKITSVGLVCLTAASIVGRKYIPTATKAIGNPIKGDQPKGSKLGG